MRFTKMHGIGNDYIYLDAVSQPHVLDADLPALAQAMSDRHFGIGGDGLIVICPPTAPEADVRMRMFNADGSESEMCGNGVRCVAKYALDRGLTDHNPLRVETGRVVLEIACTIDASGRVGTASVAMGRPILELARIPVDANRLQTTGDMTYEVAAGGSSWPGTFVSMGNPHMVVFLDDAGELLALDLPRVGPALEEHAAFPERMNVHFACVHGPGEVTMRTWERGTGITLACGTGACAVVVAGLLLGRLGRAVRVHLPGGDLAIEWANVDADVVMTGPATDVFDGDWPDPPGRA